MDQPPDPITQDNLATVEYEMEEEERAPCWLERQEALYNMPTPDQLSSRVWDPSLGNPIATSRFFRSGGRIVHSLGRHGRTLAPGELEQIRLELEPEVEHCANTAVPALLGYPVVGVVSIDAPEPGFPYIWVFFPPVVVDAATGASVIPPRQAAVWEQFDIPDNPARIRHHVACEVGRELRRMFGIVTGIRIGVPVCSDPAVFHPHNGVDLDDSDAVLLPHPAADDEYFATRPAAKMNNEDGTQPEGRSGDGDEEGGKRKRGLGDIEGDE